MVMMVMVAMMASMNNISRFRSSFLIDIYEQNAIMLLSDDLPQYCVINDDNSDDDSICTFDVVNANVSEKFIPPTVVTQNTPNTTNKERCKFLLWDSLLVL